jgi:uncharacterized membrane protein YedE/YeeE
MADFSVGPALAGGALIGLAATLLLWINGRVAGISGLLTGLLEPVRGDVSWRAVFLGAMLGVGILAAAFAPATLGPTPAGLGGLAIGGLLVGIGTRLGNGCTSGHGVCGVSRGSPRSIAATATFVAVAMATVAVSRLFGAAP